MSRAEVAVQKQKKHLYLMPCLVSCILVSLQLAKKELSIIYFVERAWRHATIKLVTMEKYQNYKRGNSKHEKLLRKNDWPLHRISQETQSNLHCSNE